MAGATSEQRILDQLVTVNNEVAKNYGQEQEHLLSLLRDMVDMRAEVDLLSDTDMGTNMINLAIESAVDEERLDARIAALQQAKVAIARSNGPVDVIAMLTEDAARAEEALDRTAADHKTVKQIRTELFDATDNDAFAPADGDDDLRVMRGPVNTICPISQQVMEDPVKGPCGHSLCKISFKQVLKRRRTMPCPVAGCSQQLSLSNLTPDQEVARAIRLNPNGRNDDAATLASQSAIDLSAAV